MDEPELFGVGKTALGVAQIRAHESQRPDQLFDDPYAAAFVAAAPTAFPDTFPGRAEAAADPLAGVGAAFAVSAVLRTRFFDDYLRQASAAGCGQVVLLAAGLDTRAYRLPWPADTRLFELDLPAVLDFKERVLHHAAAVAGCEAHRPAGGPARRLVCGRAHRRFGPVPADRVALRRPADLPVGRRGRPPADHRQRPVRFPQPARL